MTENRKMNEADEFDHENRPIDPETNELEMLTDKANGEVAELCTTFQEIQELFDKNAKSYYWKSNMKHFRQLCKAIQSADYACQKLHTLVQEEWYLRGDDEEEFENRSKQRPE